MIGASNGLVDFNVTFPPDKNISVTIGWGRREADENDHLREVGEMSAVTTPFQGPPSEGKL
jgi:hypothetical protein